MMVAGSHERACEHLAAAWSHKVLRHQYQLTAWKRAILEGGGSASPWPLVTLEHLRGGHDCHGQLLGLLLLLLQ